MCFDKLHKAYTKTKTDYSKCWLVSVAQIVLRVALGKRPRGALTACFKQGS